MDTTSGTIKCRAINGQIAALDIEGEISAQAEDAMMAAVAEATAMSVRAIILNFTKLRYMTSSGIGLLVTVYIRSNRNNIRLYAVGLQPHYLRIFDLTRLSQSIPVFTTEEEVLEKAELA